MTDELWVICGNVPVMWRMPFRFKPLTPNTGELWYALTPYPLHKLEIDKALAQMATPKDGMWLIDREALERWGTKVTGLPDDYFSWGMTASIPSQPLDPENLGRVEYCRTLFQKNVIPQVKTWQELYMIHREFCMHNLDWLLNKEQPLDFVYFKVHNCPYRVNWITILLSRFPKISVKMAKKPPVERQKYLAEMGFNDELMCLDLLASNVPLNICRRHLMIEHGKHWWRAAQSAEQQRRQRLGAYRYAEYFIHSVRRFADAARRLFFEYLAQAKAPCVAHVRGSSRWRFRFVPNIPFVRESIAHVTYLHPVIGGRPVEFKPGSKTVDLSSPNGQMSRLSVVQSQAEDVRNRGTDMVKPEDLEE